MRVIALLATYNEERYIAGCIEHLSRQGAEIYLIDNDSTDSTVEIARTYKSVIGIEMLPRNGVYRWRSILRRKEELAYTLDADWFMHVDADERHLPPSSDTTLLEALQRADEQGYTAVHFHEFVFVPTLEHPDHDHGEFENTMKWYYHFARQSVHKMNAWKKLPQRVDLTSTGGHLISSPEVRLCPTPFRMKHFLFLNREHAATKYVSRVFDEEEVREGWHGWRQRLVPAAIQLPSEKQLSAYSSDDELDASRPWKKHWLEIALETYELQERKTAMIKLRATGRHHPQAKSARIIIERISTNGLPIDFSKLKLGPGWQVDQAGHLRFEPSPDARDYADAVVELNTDDDIVLIVRRNQLQGVLICELGDRVVEMDNFSVVPVVARVSVTRASGVEEVGLPLWRREDLKMTAPGWRRPGLACITAGAWQAESLRSWLDGVGALFDEIHVVGPQAGSAVLGEGTDLRRRHFNLRIHDFTVPVGASDSAAAILHGLKKVECGNFVVWPANVVPDAAVLRQLVYEHALRSRADTFSLYFHPDRDKKLVACVLPNRPDTLSSKDGRLRIRPQHARGCLLLTHDGVRPTGRIDPEGGTPVPDPIVGEARDRLVVCITCCQRDLHQTDWINETWGAALDTLGVPYYFLIGRPGRSSELEGRVLYLDCPDSYEYLPLKTHTMARHFAGNAACSYVFKTDIGCYIDALGLLACGYWNYDYMGTLLDSAAAPDKSWWHWGKCRNNQLHGIAFDARNFGEYCDGPGYFLGRKALELIGENGEFFAAQIFEDVAIGQFLTTHGIDARNDARYQLLRFRDVRDAETWTPRVVTVDGIRDKSDFCRLHGLWLAREDVRRAGFAQ